MKKFLFLVQEELFRKHAKEYNGFKTIPKKERTGEEKNRKEENFSKIITGKSVIGSIPSKRALPWLQADVLF